MSKNSYLYEKISTQNGKELKVFSGLKWNYVYI